MKTKGLNLVLIIGILLLIVSCNDKKTTEPKPNVAIPAFNPPSSVYVEFQEVTISCATEGAAIRYTIDGSTPTESSPLYENPIVIMETSTLKAKAYKQGWEPSETATAEYTINLPSISRIDFSDIPDRLPLNSVIALYVTAYSGDDNPVADGTKIIFEATKGFFEDNEHEYENNTGYTVNGRTSVLWNTGTTPGEVTIRAKSVDVVAQVDQVIESGLASRILFGVDGNAVNVGGGLWRVQVRVTVSDVFDNKVEHGTAVHFSLADDPLPPEGTRVVSAAYTGNPGDNHPEGLAGVAFTHLTYHGKNSNLPIQIIAEVGEVREGIAFNLPLNQPTLEVHSNPQHLVFYFYRDEDNPHQTLPQSQFCDIICGVTDGQGIPVGNAKIILSAVTAEYHPYVIEKWQYTQPPHLPNILYTFTGDEPSGGRGQAYGRIRFTGRDLPLPVDEPYTRSDVQVTAYLDGYDVFAQFSLSLFRYNSPPPR